MNRINVGCGQTATPGWLNFDSSWSVRLAKHPLLTKSISIFGLVNENQGRFIAEARAHGIRWADVTKSIPVTSEFAEVIYSSHMLEHLSRDGAVSFLKEVHRVLAPGGIVRIAVPNLALFASQYAEHGDGNVFMERTGLGKGHPQGMREKLLYLAKGDRSHKWLYDDRSLPLLLTDNGFKDPQVLKPGETTISEPGDLNLREREEESLYVEARRP